MCPAFGYLWCLYDGSGPFLPPICPGLPVCFCKACGWLNLWQGEDCATSSSFCLRCCLGQKTNSPAHKHADSLAMQNSLSVGPGAGWVEDSWWHHSLSRRAGWDSDSREAVDCTKTSTAKRRCGPIISLTPPRLDPVLNHNALQTPMHACVQ